MKKKILITGAGGFIGSHLTELCVEKGYEVRSFIHYNSAQSWGWLEESECRDKVEVVMGDIRDLDSVLRATEGVDEIFHLAALIGIPYSYLSPKAYIDTNIVGTYNILESAKIHKTKNVLVTSTSETYGTAQIVPINEDHMSVGQSPYSATKIAADHLAISYFRSFNLPVKIVRPFNTFGPRQSARAFIPNVISQILSGAKELKLGNLHPTRDLTYVRDTCTGFLAIAASEALNGEATNIGMNEEISMKDLVVKISKILKQEVRIVTEDSRIRPDKSEVERLWCDNAKIKRVTGWKPQYNLDKGLEETCLWMKDHLKAYKPDIYSV